VEIGPAPLLRSISFLACVFPFIFVSDGGDANQGDINSCRLFAERTNASRLPTTGCASLIISSRLLSYQPITILFYA